MAGFFMGGGNIPVGASLLAMVVNDNAAIQSYRGVRAFIASKLAPTKNVSATAISR
jgi:hypothetical protein